MSDHSFIPKANPKIVPPAIPAPRKESFEEENARLKAEVERLRNLGIKLDGYVDLLQGENERLRKAGDACANAAYAHCMCQNCEELRDQWRDAKRGKQP